MAGLGHDGGVPAPILTGPRVTLRPLSSIDGAGRRAHGWHRVIESRYGSVRGDGPMTEAESQAWLDAATAGGDTFWVVDVGGVVAGSARLHSLRPGDAKAAYSVGMFTPRFLGAGVGTETTRLVLDHAFRGLGLHRVHLKVLASNDRAIACYTRCGFVEEGRERESCRVGDRWEDDVVMGVLASDLVPPVRDRG